MKLSTKSRYGTRAMLDIALHCDKGPVSLKDMANRQGISIKYLEQIIPTLKAAGFIRSIRGASGGYVLTKDARQIKLLDIVQALEGSLAPVDCVDIPKICSRVNDCAAHDVWKELHESINKTLGSLTLADLVERQRLKVQDHYS
ncbi:MAG: RrF2 family transcriptional regulator [Actinomycetota bacterium]|nr:RrF2 family transcriptional regulator [Actinomycetota bacterium]